MSTFCQRRPSLPFLPTAWILISIPATRPVLVPNTSLGEPRFFCSCLPREPTVRSEILLEPTGLMVILVVPEQTSASWFPSVIQLLSGKPWLLPCALSTGCCNLSFSSDSSAFMGLAPEQQRLERLHLPPDVVRRIQGLRAVFTTVS